MLKAMALWNGLGLAHETTPGQCYHKSTVPQLAGVWDLSLQHLLSSNLTTGYNCLQLLWGTPINYFSNTCCAYLYIFWPRWLLPNCEAITMSTKGWGGDNPALPGICETTTVTSLALALHASQSNDHTCHVTYVSRSHVMRGDAPTGLALR